MLMSVSVQNILDMIVYYALCVAVLKREFLKIIGGQVVERSQVNTVVAISEGAADEAYCKAILIILMQIALYKYFIIIIIIIIIIIAIVIVIVIVIVILYFRGVMESHFV